MPYTTDLARKLNADIDIASGGCRVRNQIIKLWKHYSDLEKAIDNVQYLKINKELMESVKQKYRDLIS